MGELGKHKEADVQYFSNIDSRSPDPTLRWTRAYFALSESPSRGLRRSALVHFPLRDSIRCRARVPHAVCELAPEVCTGSVFSSPFLRFTSDGAFMHSGTVRPFRPPLFCGRSGRRGLHSR